MLVQTAWKKRDYKPSGTLTGGRIEQAAEFTVYSYPPPYADVNRRRIEQRFFQAGRFTDST